MSERGIAPLIATVVLVGLTVSVTVILVLFAKQNTKTTTEFADIELQKFSFSRDLKFRIEESNVITSQAAACSYTLIFTLSNNGDVSAKGKVFVDGVLGREAIVDGIYLKDSSVPLDPETAFFLNPFEIKTYSICFSYAGVIDHLLFIPMDEQGNFYPNNQIKWTPLGLAERNAGYAEYA